MSEKKKFMPTITNYLSDNDEEVDDEVSNESSPTTGKKNYAEWKRTQKATNNISNGTRSIQAPLGDISSCEEDSKFDDNDPLYKIMNVLSDKEAFRKRNNSLRKRHKKPSHYLLYSRMKQIKHYDCSFSDLCQITQASWENMQSVENEELMGNIDQRSRDYKEVLLKIKASLLPDSAVRPKLNSLVTTHVAHKLSPPAPPNHILTPGSIPERLQGLAGNASVYNAPDKSKRTTTSSNHRLTVYKTRAMSNSDTSLNYVSPVNNNQKCQFPDCDNEPIDDYRWDGQYCSVKCLIEDCNRTFQEWLADQKEQLLLGNTEEIIMIENGKMEEEEEEVTEKISNGEEEGKKEEEEIMQLLGSPSQEESPVYVARDGPVIHGKNIFECLQRTNKIQPKYTFDTDIDSGTDLVAASRLHSLITRSSSQSPTRLDGFEYFHDRPRQQQQSVTETTL